MRVRRIYSARADSENPGIRYCEISGRKKATRSATETRRKRNTVRTLFKKLLNSSPERDSFLLMIVGMRTLP
jgi:hypothetical protein